MKIAVTYDNGNVFQHFGRTENFKVYEVEDNKVISSEIIGSNGIGHGALAGLLADEEIEVLICGGIGAGAQNALAEAGITLVAGAEGNTDDVVASYLAGELISTGANCDHHDHEEGHSCGDHGCGDFYLRREADQFEAALGHAGVHLRASGGRHRAADAVYFKDRCYHGSSRSSAAGPAVLSQHGLEGPVVRGISLHLRVLQRGL